LHKHFAVKLDLECWGACHFQQRLP